MSAHQARRTTLALIAAFLLSLPAVTTRLYAADEIEYFAYLRSLWFDGDLSFDNEYRSFYDRGIARAFNFRETFLELTTETGLRINFATIGCALLWAPFYAAADVGVRLANQAGASVPADGFSHPYIAAVAYGSAVYGFLAVLLSVAVARRIVGTGATAGVMVWLGTPLLFYMYLAPGMAHACSAFVVSAFVLAWLHVRQRWSMGGCVGLGALAALMAMTREQDAFLAIGPLVDWGWMLVGGVGGARLLLNAIVGVSAFILTFLPQLAAYLILNGRLGPSQVVAGKMNWLAPHAAQVLFSPEHGLLAWTPLAAISLVGLVLLAMSSVPETRRLGLCALIMMASQVYVSGSVESWTAAGAFGQRRFVGTTVLLVLGLAVILTRAGGQTWEPTKRPAKAGRYDLSSRRRWGIGTLTAACVWWNLSLMVQFGAGMMDRQRLELPRNAYNTFIEVPRRLPEIAWRYFVDRSSFYGSTGR